MQDIHGWVVPALAWAPATHPMETEPDLTLLLAAARGGDRASLDRVFERVYGELARLARAQLRRIRGFSSLDTTALVHEFYLRVSGTSRLTPVDRVHFFSLAARAMRQVLLSEAERMHRQKRGGDVRHVPLPEDVADPATWQAGQLLAVDTALGELEKAAPDLARIVEMRFFGGMTECEIGLVIGRGERTVRRDWRKARAFLRLELERLGYPA